MAALSHHFCIFILHNLAQTDELLPKLNLIYVQNISAPELKTQNVTQKNLEPVAGLKCKAAFSKRKWIQA